MSNSSIVAAYSVQLCSASVSMIASSAILIMIMISSRSFSSPHRRIIFGLTMGDLMVSLAVLTGPFFVPSGIWSIGNVDTCNVNGFLFQYGFISVSMYMVLLICYFYKKIVKQMSNKDFCTKIEKISHIFIHALTLCICISAGVLKSFNPLGRTEYVSMCAFARYPYNCIEDECTRGKYFAIFWISIVIGLVIVFITMLVFLTLLCKYAVLSERRILITEVENGNNRTEEHQKSIAAMMRAAFKCCRCSPVPQRPNETNIQYNVRAWRRQILIQALFYSVSYAFPYLMLTIPLVVVRLTGNDLPFPIKISSYHGLFPLQGLFNILIYTRTKVQRFRSANPEFSWLYSFLLVVKAGGEIPDIDVDINALSLKCRCCTSANQEQMEEEISDISAFSRLPRTTTGSGPSRVSDVISTIMLIDNRTSSHNVVNEEKQASNLDNDGFYNSK